MKQLLIIHGGTSFSSYGAYREYLLNKSFSVEKLTHPIRWKERLASDLSEYQVLYPSMPNATNAVYEEWVVYFEKLLALLEDDAIILGHSLGAMFVAKYFDEHTLAHPLDKIILVAGGYDDDSVEDLGSFKVRSAAGLQTSAKEVHLFHSIDDPVVPFSELAKYQADLPSAITHTFKDRGHFIDEEFPELLKLLKQK